MERCYGSTKYTNVQGIYDPGARNVGSRLGSKTAATPQKESSNFMACSESAE
jgi:hypothetical protein